MCYVQDAVVEVKKKAVQGVGAARSKNATTWRIRATSRERREGRTFK